MYLNVGVWAGVIKKKGKRTFQHSMMDDSRIDLILGDVVNSFSKVLDVARRDTSHGNTAITGKVDVPVILELVNLFGSKTRETEHTNL